MEHAHAQGCTASKMQHGRSEYGVQYGVWSVLEYRVILVYGHNVCIFIYLDGVPVRGSQGGPLLSHLHTAIVSGEGSRHG